MTLQWFVYGYLISDSFIQVSCAIQVLIVTLGKRLQFQIPNFLGCILSSIQLGLFVIYPSRIDVKYKQLTTEDVLTF